MFSISPTALSDVSVLPVCEFKRPSQFRSRVNMILWLAEEQQSPGGAALHGPGCCPGEASGCLGLPEIVGSKAAVDEMSF